MGAFNPVTMITKDELKAALRKHAGIYAAAAKELGCDRSNITHRVKGDPELQAFVEGITSEIDDLAQGIVVSTLGERTMGNKPTKDAQQMAKWWREYRLRVQTAGLRVKAAAEVPVPGGLSLTVTIEYVDALPEPEDEEIPA